MFAVCCLLFDGWCVVCVVCCVLVVGCLVVVCPMSDVCLLLIVV